MPVVRVRVLRWRAPGYPELMLIYLDICSIQRPLDDLSRMRVRLEAEAVDGIIGFCKARFATLVSSDALEFEDGGNTDPVRKEHAVDVLNKAGRFVPFTAEVRQRALVMEGAGLKSLDALHLSSAVEAGADYFCRCDDRLLRRARAAHPGPPKVVSPLELIGELNL